MANTSAALLAQRTGVWWTKHEMPSLSRQRKSGIIRIYIVICSDMVYDDMIANVFFLGAIVDGQISPCRGAGHEI